MLAVGEGLVGSQAFRKGQMGFRLQGEPEEAQVCRMGQMGYPLRGEEVARHCRMGRKDCLLGLEEEGACCLKVQMGLLQVPGLGEQVVLLVVLAE